LIAILNDVFKKLQYVYLNSMQKYAFYPSLRRKVCFLLLQKY